MHVVVQNNVIGSGTV